MNELRDALKAAGIETAIVVDDETKALILNAVPNAIIDVEGVRKEFEAAGLGRLKLIFLHGFEIVPVQSTLPEPLVLEKR